VNVITTMIYQSSRRAGAPNYGEAGAYSICLVVILLGLMFWQNSLSRHAKRYQTITGKGFRPRVIDLGGWRYVTCAVLVGLFLMVTVVPVSMLAFTSFQPFYGGVSLDHIAKAVGASKQNLLYYFPSKEALYRRVLHGVLDVWLLYMDNLSQRQDDPELALREYIAGKLRFSRERPDDSRVYANEVLSGAPIFAAEIAERVVPSLQADVAIFNRWAEQGLCRPVDGQHLMILLWASTQVYVDWASQISLVLGKPALEAQDFADAESMIVDMVLRTVLVPAAR
jgi:TetR/AcrR family transcriptional regulator